MTNRLDDVLMHLADEFASTMVFAILNACAVNAPALEGHEGWCKGNTPRWT
jgi:hypothetical protein